MKDIRNSLFLVFIIAIISSCDTDELEKINYCEKQTGYTIENEIGRIYYRNTFGDNFHYIGGPDSTARGYAFIPCQVLDKDIRSTTEVGVLVIYSGSLTQPLEYPEGVDPLLQGIELTMIKKAN